MGKNIFVSADWKDDFVNSLSDDKIVVERIRTWSNSANYGVNFRYTDAVHKSVLNSNNPDCRRCDIKLECEHQIEWSSIVIIVIGDKTKTKGSGACDGQACSPAESWKPKVPCKLVHAAPGQETNVVYYAESYLEHEIRIALTLKKKIILVFNSVNVMIDWIPQFYLSEIVKNPNLELCRVPFWQDLRGGKDCYTSIKRYLL